jgi:spore germination protein KB
MRPLAWAAVTAVIIILLNIIPTLMLFGPELTVNMAYPTLEVIRYIRAGMFLENLDPLLIVFWLFTMFLKISVFTLTSVIALTHTAGIHNHKPFSYLLTAAMVVFALYLFPSSAEVGHVTTHSETAFLLLTCMVPVLYLLVDWIRSRGKRQPGKAKAEQKS